MASQWIDAATARRIVADGGSLSGAERSICTRAHAGMLSSRARLFLFGEEKKENCLLPSDFWWAEGHIALEQDWVTGDFSTWMEKKIELRAFGVEFDAAGILAFLPVERRPIIARSLSVEADPNWLSTRAAREEIEKREGLYWQDAQRRLIELVELGFVSARAVQMTRHHPRSTSLTIEREWDVPLWFWDACMRSTDAKADWTLGSFSGKAFVGGNWSHVKLTGVHFLRDTLIPPSEARSEQSEVCEQDDSKPRLPELKLMKWWDALAGARDGLSNEELLILARAKFPENHVARDRIRVLAGGRKRGPRPKSDKSAAE